MNDDLQDEIDAAVSEVEADAGPEDEDENFCPTCGGSGGGRAPMTCPTCRGTGEKRRPALRRNDDDCTPLYFYSW